MGTPNYQVETLATCVGQQPGVKIWVLNKTLQLTKDGELISESDQIFHWYDIFMCI